jgi:hypothetical protein
MLRILTNGFRYGDGMYRVGRQGSAAGCPSGMCARMPYKRHEVQMNAVVFMAMLTSLAVFQSGRAQAEIHLIPDGYVGWVAVAFRAMNGEAPMYEGDARLYRIPRSGVLLTQAEPNRGISPAWKFFFEGTGGTRTPIQLISASPVPDTPANRADPTIGVFALGRGRAPGGAARCQVEFDMYFVGTKAQLLVENLGNRFQGVGRVLASQYSCP